MVITSNSHPVLTTYYKSIRDDKLPDLGVAFAQAYISGEFIETTKMPSVYMTDLKTVADAGDTGTAFDIYLVQV